MDTATSTLLGIICGGIVVQIGTYLLGKRKAITEEKAAELKAKTEKMTAENVVKTAEISAQVTKDKALLEAEAIREKARIDAAALVKVTEVTTEAQKATAAVDLQGKMLSEMLARMDAVTLKMGKLEEELDAERDKRRAFQEAAAERDITIKHLQAEMLWSHEEVTKANDKSVECERKVHMLELAESQCREQVQQLREQIVRSIGATQEPLPVVPAVPSETLDKGLYHIEAAEPVAAVPVS